MKKKSKQKNKAKVDKQLTSYIGYDIINYLDHKMHSMAGTLVENPDMDKETIAWTNGSIKEYKRAIKIIKSISEKAK